MCIWNKTLDGTCVMVVIFYASLKNVLKFEYVCSDICLLSPQRILYRFSYSLILRNCNKTTIEQAWKSFSELWSRNKSIRKSKTRNRTDNWQINFKDTLLKIFLSTSNWDIRLKIGHILQFSMRSSKMEFANHFAKIHAIVFMQISKNGNHISEKWKLRNFEFIFVLNHHSSSRKMN